MLLSTPTFSKMNDLHYDPELAEEAKTKKGRRKKILTLLCEWDNCEVEHVLCPEEYQIFADHIKSHIDGAVEKANEELSCKGETQFPTFECLWRICTWETGNDLQEFNRHVYFHGYHSKLKCNGAIAEMSSNILACTLESETQNLLPDLSQPFICLWDSCQTKFDCPDKFYRHVDEHTFATEPVINITSASEDSNLPSTSFLDYGKNTTLIKSWPKSFMCIWEGCGSFTFKNIYKLREHCRVHTKEKAIACPNCGGFFSNRTKFSDHLTRQNSEAYQDFQCSHCLKRCASERLLRDHMRHHVNHLKCPHCDMTCPNPSALKEHIRFRHRNEKSHKCDMCPYSCKSHCDLQRHEETHFPKRYQCAVPDCEFSTKTLHCLKRHHRTKHAVGIVDRFVCHICNSRYTRGTGLTNHLKRKHNFSWPSGHPRFRYREYEDGLYRLQMVRFESAELTQQLAVEDEPKLQNISDLSSTETLSQEEQATSNSNLTNGTVGEPTAMVAIQEDGTVIVVPLEEDVPLDTVDENMFHLPSVVMHSSGNLESNEEADAASAGRCPVQIKETELSSNNQLASDKTAAATAVAYQLLLDYFEHQLQAKVLHKKSPEKGKENVPGTAEPNSEIMMNGLSDKGNLPEKTFASLLVTENASALFGTVDMPVLAGVEQVVATASQTQEPLRRSPRKLHTNLNNLLSESNSLSKKESQVADYNTESPSKRETRSYAKKAQNETGKCERGDITLGSDAKKTISGKKTRSRRSLLCTGKSKLYHDEVVDVKESSIASKRAAGEENKTKNDSGMKLKGSKKRKSKIELNNDEESEEILKELSKKRQRKCTEISGADGSCQPNEFDQILDISKTLLSLKESSVGS